MSYTWRSFIVLAITVGIFIYEAWGSYATNSRGILSDALHMLGDGFPFFLQWWAAMFLLSQGERSRFEKGIRTYNFWFLCITAACLGLTGLYRLYSPQAVEAGMLHFAVVGLVGNASQYSLAHGFERSQMLHLIADICGSAGVLMAALIVTYTGYVQADSIATLAVAAITAWAAWGCRAGHSHAHACHAHGPEHHH